MFNRNCNNTNKRNSFRKGRCNRDLDNNRRPLRPLDGRGKGQGRGLGKINGVCRRELD